MADLLILNAVVVTMTDAGDEHHGADILVRDGVIHAVGDGCAADARPGVEVIDATACVVTPGLVNTHHHLFQTLTRAVPAAVDAGLFGWLRALYPVWARMTPDDVALSARLGLAELALSGCTMSSDHLYLFPNGTRLTDTFPAAADVGIRLHATRGAMSIGESAGGLPPDSLVEAEPAILRDMADLVDAHHDPAPSAMLRIALAPCSPFSVSQGLMRDTAVLAREKGVMLHTHLAENDEDVAFSLARFGCRPGAYAEALGWLGPDVWHAHCVKLDGSETELFARTMTGVAHCACSNCRLGSGIAPVAAMRRAGVRVGLGVDGSASNDAGHLLAEARQAMLLQRVASGAGAMPARAVLRMATRGGAEVLGRGDHLGQIRPGFRADLAIWDMGGLTSVGAWDPVAALVLAPPAQVRDLIVEGRPVIRNGAFTTFDPGVVARAARARARALANGD